MTRYTMLVMLALAQLVSAALSSTGQVDSAADFLKHHVAASNLPEDTVEHAFMSALREARVPGGIVTVLNCDARRLGENVSLPDGPLQGALDTIVKTQPNYHWDAEDGVINLIGAKQTPTLLEVRIDSLEVENATHLQSPVALLLSRPEVRRTLGELHLSEGVRILTGPGSLAPPVSFTVNCRNTTVREALNAIVRAHGGAIWEYRERRCNGTNEFWIEFVSQWASRPKQR